MSQTWWHLLLIPALRGRVCEFKGSLVYRGSSRTAKAAQRNHVLKNQWLVGWLDERMDEWVDAWVDGCMDRYKGRNLFNMSAPRISKRQNMWN